MTALCLGMLLLTSTSMVFAFAEGDCYAEQHPNGSTTFYINKTVPKDSEYSWNINGVNHANENALNSTTVVIRGPNFVTFERCYVNVTHRTAHTGKIINCPCNCSTMKSPKDPQKDLRTPSTLSTVVWSTGGGVALVLCIISCVCVYQKRKVLQIWFQKKNFLQRGDYIQARNNAAMNMT